MRLNSHSIAASSPVSSPT